MSDTLQYMNYDNLSPAVLDSILFGNPATAPQQISYSPNPTPIPSPSIWDNISGFISGIGQVVGAGASAVAANAGKIAAIAQITKDTLPGATSTVNVPGQMPNKLPTWVMPMAVIALVIIGIVVVRKMR